MRLLGLLAACLLLCAITVSVAEPRRKSGGSGRKSSSSPRRSGTGTNQGHQESSPGFTYPGYNSQAKKQGQPSAPKQEGNIGWNAPKDTSGSHAYPASSGLSGSNKAPNPYQVGSPASHSYPASNGASGANKAPNPYQVGSPASHSYPASGGLSGTGSQQNLQSSNIKPANNPPPYSSINQSPQQGNRGYPAQPGYNQGGYNHPNPPPPYSAGAPYSGGYGGYHGGGGYGGYGGYGGGMQPSFGGFGGGGFGGGSPGFGGHGGYMVPYQKKSSFLGGNTFGAILTGLAVWNLVRSGQKTTNYYNYYNYNNGTSGAPASGGGGGAAVSAEHQDIKYDPILTEMNNCSLTITEKEKTEVTLIPCIVVSSFASNEETIRNLKEAADSNKDGLNCVIGILFKNSTERKIEMPCATLSKMAPPENETAPTPQVPGQQMNCTPGLVTEELQPGNSHSCRLSSTTVEGPLEVLPLNSTTASAEVSTSTTSTTTLADSTITSDATSTTTTTTPSTTEASTNQDDVTAPTTVKDAE